MRRWSYAPADDRGHGTSPVPPGRARPRGGRDHCRPDRDHSEMAHRRPSRCSQGAQGGLSALYGKAARRARVLISPRSVPRRWMYSRAGTGRTSSRCPSRAATTGQASSRLRKSAMAAVMPVSKVFSVQQNRHDRSQEHLQALAVPVPAARAWPQAHQKDRARRLAAGDRGAVSREISPGGCSTRTATGVSTGCAETGATATTGTSTRGTCSPTTPRTSCGSAAQTLDQLGVAWRFSKPNTISVATQGGRGPAG